MSKKGFTYTLQIDAEINDLIAKTAQVKKSMQSIMDVGKAPGAEKVFASIEKAIERLQTKASQPIESVAAFQNLQKDAAAVGVSLGKLGTIIENLGNMEVGDKLDLLPPNLKKQIEDASAALTAFSKATALAEQKTQDLTDAETQLASAQKELKKAEGRVQDKKALVAAQQQLVDAAHAEADAIKAKIEALRKYQATAAAYEAAGGNKSAKGDSKANAGKGLEGLNLPGDRKAAVAAMPDLNPSDTQAVADAIARLNDEYRQASKTVTDTEATQRRYNSQLTDANNAAQLASGKVTTLTSTVARLNTEFEKNKIKNVQTAYAQLRNEAGKLGVDLTKIPLDYTEQSFNDLNTAMNQLVIDGVSQVDASLNTIQFEMGETSTSAQDLGDRMNIASNEVTKLDETVANTTAITERIKQFVGLAGGVEIARTAMRNAFSTIKELDAAMTEMAVVTEFEVGDYWDQLPEYTARANALGVSIKSAYESATLYYQQGLKTNEVVAMSNETLKMARIAGLSAEDATNKMTAALRGFNMELNETSAQRVADVYSELAAITASDVDEISSAMTKTASIAASAGMEFETTAAFLSQIIETTRESAETAGTALKTVIARFQELKKDPSEIGEVDGEIVDANKIETALRSVGVSLRDASGQFRELDDVFLELSSKWDSLDTNTQRYIATIAAGSRQQSRFIAMMSDYSRTQELVTAANSSAGASNEQFEKTMDSLESKLNELKNAWDSFTMGIMNSDVLKAGIDLLTGILTAINNITDAFGDFSGAAKIGLLVTALYLGDKALKVFTSSLQGGSTIFGAFGKVGKTALTSIQTKLVSLNKIMSMTFGKKGINVGFSKETLARSKKDLSAYTEATRKHASAKAMLNNLEEKGATDTALYSAVQQRAADTERERVAVEGNLMAALGLNEAQMAATTAMTAMGVSADKAAILAKAGISAQNLAAAVSYSGLSAAQVGAQLAAKLENASAVRVLSTKIALTIANWAQTASEKAKAGSLWASITATIAQTMANWGLQASMWPILVIGLLVVAAFAALVAIVWLLIKAFKAWKANSPEGKLEAAKEASEAAAEAAEAAAEAYNHLAESLENLSDKYKTLEDLAQGTKEWRDAVREVNSEVLELVEQYPELAGYVKNEGGVLKLDIESDEVQGVLDQYEKDVVETRSASLAGKVAVLEAQNKVDYEALNDDTKLGNQSLILAEKIAAGTIATMFATMTVGAGTPAAAMGSAALMYDAKVREQLNEQTTNAMAEALAKGLIVQKETGEWVSTGEESEKELADLGLTIETVQAFGEELGDNVQYLKEYGEQIQERKEQEKALYEALALNAVQMVDSSKLTEEQLKYVNTAASADYITHFEKETIKSIQDETKDMGKEAYADWAKSKAMELYGTDEISVDDDGNVTIGTGDNAKTVDRESFEKQLAAANATEEAAENLQNLPKAIEAASKKMGDEAGKALSKSYSAVEGKAMTRSDIEALEGQDLQAVWDQLDESQQQAFGSFEIFSQHVQDSINLSKAAFDVAAAGLTEMGATIEFNGKLTSEAAKGYGDQLEHVMANMGQAGVDVVNDALGELADTMDEEELAKFMSQINALDWKSMEEWDNLPDILEQIGLNVPNAELQNFIKVAQESAGAIRNIDLESLNAQMADLQSIVKRVKTGEQGRVFSSQDYESLVEAVPSLAGKFQQTLEGDYVYLGSAMQDLTIAIQDNTAALLKEAQGQLQNKIDAAQLMDRMAKTFGWEGAQANILDWKKWNEDESASNIRGYLFAFIEEAVKNGLDLKQLGIENLSNRTKVENLTDEQIEEILDQLVGTFNDWDKNTQLLMDKTVNALSLTYQNRDATLNSSEASRYRFTVARGESLTEEEEVAFKASTNALTSQAVMAGVNSVAINDYSKTVAAMEELYKKHQNKEIGDTEFKTQYTKLYAQIASFEREITNKINLNTMNSALQSTMESIGGLGEELDNLTDKASKMEVVAQMVDQFGIKVNKSNYEQIAALAQGMTEGGEAGYKAFTSLMQMAAENYGLTLHQLQTMTITNWNDTTNQMPKQMQEFADMMVAAGSAMWVEMANGGKRFVLATENHLNSAAESADTIKEMWENPYDALYNLEQRMNALVRKREKLERAYEKALQDSGVSAQELVDITASQLNTLRQEAILQKNIAKQASENISNKIKENSQYKELYQFDKITGRIAVDYTKVDSMNFDADEGDDFEEFISYLEEQSDVMKTAQDSFNDIEDSVKEIKQRGRDSVSSIYNQVKEGLIKNYETQLQELENINNSIQEAASAMLSKMQEQIDETRQARDNEKTENEISDKELRLAYLMQDTSGGNAIEIAALQKEITEAKKSYTDTLVDQAIDNLSKENERAAEQRERQIELQREQLDAYANSSEVWNQVKRIVDDGFAQVALGVPFVETEAGKLAAINEGIDSLNPLEKEDFVTELNVMAKEGAIYEGFVSITGEKDSQTTIADLAGVVDETINSLREEAEKPVLVKTKQDENKDDNGDEKESFWEKIFNSLKNSEEEATETEEPTVTEVIVVTGGKTESDFVYDLNRLRRDFAYKQYATGGVADFTGPAWLDGTKTRPEIVLNQTDSANFIQLRDILADILQGTSSLSTSEGKSKGGDNYFDIEINVESITDDYDVEQLADKIRSMIYEDSTYRNVNSITGLR